MDLLNDVRCNFWNASLKVFQTHSNKMRDVQKNTALLIANKTAGLLRLSMLEISLL